MHWGGRGGLGEHTLREFFSSFYPSPFYTGNLSCRFIKFSYSFTMSSKGEVLWMYHPFDLIQSDRSNYCPPTCTLCMCMCESTGLTEKKKNPCSLPFSQSWERPTQRQLSSFLWPEKEWLLNRAAKTIKRHRGDHSKALQRHPTKK